MTTNNGWPGKPGVPLNPEKGGWHWLKRISNGWETLAKWDNDWNGNDDFWWNLPGYSDPERVAKGFQYLGPALTPDEATALQARADRNAAGFARVDAEAQCAEFLHKQEIAALQKRCEEAERERDALRRDASQEIATDEMVRRLQHLGDWQAADRIEALQKRVAKLEGALDFYACVDHYQTRNAVAPNVVQSDRGAKARAALEGGKDE